MFNNLKKGINSKYMIFPSFLITCVISYIPLAYALWMSLFKIEGKEKTFIGFNNYLNIIVDSEFSKAIFNSTIFSVLTVPVIIIYSLLIAFFIISIKNEKLQGLFIVLFYIPCITSPVAYSLFYKQLAYSNGIISQLLGGLNILQNMWTARLYIVLICTWAWSGFYVLLFISSINNIDKNLYKLAKIDGLSMFSTFRNIILPTIRPVFNFITVLVVNSTLQMYVESSLVTKGGPKMSTYTLTYHLYKKTFTYSGHYGYSFALGVIILLFSIAITFLLMKRKNNEKFY